MPTYEYLCESNGRVLEVQHKMAERLETWGELCARAGIAVGRTPAATPVKKLMSGAFVASGRSAATDNAMCAAEGCASGPCGSGMCEMD